MTAATHLEYVGFKSNPGGREYTLRVKHPAGEFQDYTLIIPNEAFLAHRARYQDGPDICFLKLQRELTAAGQGSPAACLNITDAELEEYRVAHSPRAPQRRPPASPSGLAHLLTL